jgi:hypothetical protein
MASLGRANVYIVRPALIIIIYLTLKVSLYGIFVYFKRAAILNLVSKNFIR